MPDNSEHAPHPRSHLRSPQRVRLEDGAEKKKISRTCREQAIGFPTYVHVYTATATAGESGESKAFQKLHCGHRVAPVPGRQSPAERWQAHRRDSSQGLWEGGPLGEGRSLVSVPHT